MNLFFIADTRANRLFCVDSDGLVCDEFGENSKGSENGDVVAQINLFLCSLNFIQV
jgi:hypothetical protein